MTDPTVRQIGIPWPFEVEAGRLHNAPDFRWERTSRPAGLARTIRALKPDVLHTLELQHAAYLALERARDLGPQVAKLLAASTQRVAR